MLDIYTIIFLALAVFIFVRLRSVLGQRTGKERPPYDPYSRDAQRPPGQPGPAAENGNGNVVNLPDRGADASRAAPPPLPLPGSSDVIPGTFRWQGVAQEGSPLAEALDQIAAVERDFDAKHFITGAKSAYEMIVLAFAAGDRKTLKDLLSKEVYDGFEEAIKQRESRGETMESRFVAIEKAELVEASVRNRTAQLTLRFVSQLLSVTRGRDGEVVDGSSDTVADVTDVWTFARDLGARDPNWKLVATEAAQ